MAAVLLTICGLFLAGYGVWRSWTNGRRLLLPVAGASERPAVTDAPEQSRGASPWPEIRRAAWQLALAIGWLVVAMLGLFMLTVAGEAAR